MPAFDGSIFSRWMAYGWGGDCVEHLNAHLLRVHVFGAVAKRSWNYQLPPYTPNVPFVNLPSLHTHLPRSLCDSFCGHVVPLHVFHDWCNNNLYGGIKPWVERTVKRCTFLLTGKLCDIFRCSKGSKGHERQAGWEERWAVTEACSSSRMSSMTCSTLFTWKCTGFW